MSNKVKYAERRVKKKQGILKVIKERDIDNVCKRTSKKVFEYQKAGDKDRVSVLRYLLSQIKNKEIEMRVDGCTPSKEDIVQIIRKQIKQRQQSADLYRQGKREELAEKEEHEKELLAEILEYVENF